MKTSLNKTMKTYNLSTDHISLTYDQYYKILESKITQINIYKPDKSYIKTLNLTSEIISQIKPISNCFLLKYK